MGVVAVLVDVVVAADTVAVVLVVVLAIGVVAAHIAAVVVVVLLIRVVSEADTEATRGCRWFD